MFGLWGVVMSAEKEIVNYWYNRKGFFTINNIKANNRDIGLLALKFGKNAASEILHVEVSCSITNNVSDTKNLSKSINAIIEEKFYNKSIVKALFEHVRRLSVEDISIRKVMVFGAVPKSRKKEIIAEFGRKNVEVIEFENVLFEVLDKMDTQYYKNDIIRSLQLMKFILFNEPAKMANLLSNLSSNSRKKFLSMILEKDEIMREFKKTNSERLGAILRNSKIKPGELASMLQNNILNKKTRKPFLDSLMQEESSRKIMQPKKKKMEMELKRFFN